MQITAIDLAWIKGESSYIEGENLLAGMKKAEAERYQPQSQAFAAFLGGFS